MSRSQTSTQQSFDASATISEAAHCAIDFSVGIGVGVDEQVGDLEHAIVRDPRAI